MTTPLVLLLALQATPAPPVQPRDVVNAMFAAFNRHDAEGLARLYAPDARVTSSDYCRPRNREGVARTYAALFAEFPDIRDEVETTVVEGDTVAVRFTAVSRAKNLKLPIQAMLQVKNGLIVRDDSVFDNGGRPCEP